MDSAPPSEESFLNQFREDSVDSLETSPRFLHSQYEEESQNSDDYSRRFIYELIQNADDALGSTEGRDAVARFELTDDYLYVANTGRGIEQRDVDSLCTMGVSGKSVEDGEHETIGHKGRGFTSVLEITDRPAVYSTGISFRFDPEDSTDCLETAIENRDGMTKDMVPVLCLPFPVSERPEEVDRLLSSDHHPCKFQTVFALELFDDVREQVERDLRDIDRELLLFLQNVERLEVQIGDEEFTWTLDRDHRRVDDVEVTRVSIEEQGPSELNESSESKQYVVFRRPSLQIPERITNKPDEAITHAEVGIALRYVRRSDGVHLRPFPTRPMFHVFLPTELQSPIPVQINGAFNTNMSREQIPLDLDTEDQYNAFLLASALDLFPDAVLPLARDTATTASDLLDCFSLPWTETPESAPSFVHEFAKRLRDTVLEMEWLPTVSDSESLCNATSLLAPSETRLPPGSDAHPDLARDIASLSSVEHTGESGDIGTQIPHQSVLDPNHHTLLKRLGVEVVPETTVPAMLEAAAANVSLHPYESVGKRRAVDPIIDVLLRVHESHIDEDPDGFKDACANAALFPIDSTDGSGVKRVQKNEDRLFLPPEDGPSHLPVDGFQFLASAVYRPDGWTGSRGSSGQSDEFKADLQQLWPLDEFRFDTFAQGVIIPKLPSPGRTTGEEDVESLERLEVLKLVRQLGVESVDPESPLPYEQRAKTDLFPLCRLPVPTRDGGWKPAHSVYFGAEWQSEVPEHGRVEPLLRAADIDAPFIASPNRFIDKSDTALEDEESESKSDENSKSPENAWWEFLTWLGVREHVHLTPLFGPSQQQYYSEVKDFTAPDHPSALDAVEPARWQEYREYLLESVEEYPFEGFSSKSLYSLHGIENIDTFVAKARADNSFAGWLFSHFECWWETPPGGATNLSQYSDVVVGLNRTRYHNVIGRGNGIPYSQERHAIGRNLWLWQLRSRQWIPTDSGLYRPTAVWHESRATQRVALQLGPDDQIDLLPVITIDSDAGESVLAGHLGIRSDLDTELRPEDARCVVENLATFIKEQFPDDERSERISTARRSIQTVYRNLTRRLPSTQQSATKLPNEWENAREILAETTVVAKTNHGFDLHPASETVFVRSDSAFREAHSLGAATFLLSERDAGAFGDWFGLQDFNTHLVREIHMGAETDETERLHQWLSRAAPYLLSRLEVDRPEQADEDLRALRSFVNDVRVVEKLQVVRRLDLDHRTLPEDTTAVEFVDPNDGDVLVDIYDGAHKRPRPMLTLPESDREDRLCRRAAKLLCDHVAFSNVEAVLLAIQSSRNGDLESYARYADLDGETVDRKQAAFEGKSVSYGFDDVDPSTFSGPTSFEQEVTHTERSDTEQDSDDSTGDPSTDGKSEPSTEDSSPAPLHEVESLAVEGTEILEGTGGRPEPTTGSDGDETGGRSNELGRNQRASPSQATRDDEIESVGTDLVTVFEAQRLVETYDVSDPSRYIFDVSQTSQTRDPDDELLDAVLTDLASEASISKRYPGFDLLVVHPENHEAERLIEIKASTGDNGRGSMTLNEWRTAERDTTQQRYWLYVVGNLSVDATGEPFIRRIENPAKALYAREETEERVQSKVRVYTADFEEGVEVKETRYIPRSDHVEHRR